MSSGCGCSSRTQFFNHEWDNPEALETIGVLSEARYREGLDWAALENRPRTRSTSWSENYDQLMVIGPVFPHEVVGFSGGNKYFFPGISGPDLLNFFHWLGALITTSASSE